MLRPRCTGSFCLFLFISPAHSPVHLGHRCSLRAVPGPAPVPGRGGRSVVLEHLLVLVWARSASFSGSRDGRTLSPFRGWEDPCQELEKLAQSLSAAQWGWGGDGIQRGGCLRPPAPLREGSLAPPSPPARGGSSTTGCWGLWR